MAVDMFLKIDGIDGESKDSQHQDEIDVLDWNWGMNQTGTSGVGGGGGSGKVSVDDLTFSHYVDKASPNLMLYCCKGDPIGEAKLTVRKAGGDALEYLKITMTDVVISSVDPSGAAGSDLLTENVTLNFAKVEVEYVPQKPDGSGAEPVTMCWNIEKNEQC